MIHIQIPADIKLLTPDELQAELKSAVEAGPTENLAGTPCYDITPAAARTIASIHGSSEDDGRKFLWALANGMRVPMSKAHNEIDRLVHDYLHHGEADDDVDDGVALLKFLQGWLYSLPTDSPFKVDVLVPLQISSISVTDLIGRYVVNMNGMEFKITDVRYNLERDDVTFELADLDEDGNVIPDTESGLLSLQSFRVL